MSTHQGNSSGRRKSSSTNGRGNGRKKTVAQGNSPVKRRVTTPSNKPKKSNPEDGVRLNKYIANSGACSRREADMHISLGNVTVNGKIVNEMGYKVKPGDEVKFDGARINPEKKAYVLLNKPKGFATTTSLDKGRTVMDLVANATSSRIKPIGRLGRGSTGLVLFTNDEEVTAKFSNSRGVSRLFHVQLNKKLEYEHFAKIKEGFKIQGKEIIVEEISRVEGASKKEIGLKIKNTGISIIRTIFEHFEYEIEHLDCVMIGHLTKKDLPRGRWKHLSQQEINTLMML